MPSLISLILAKTLGISFRVRLVKNSPPVTLAQYSKILSPLTRFPDIRVLRVNITTPDLSASDAASSRVMWLKLSSPSLIQSTHGALACSSLALPYALYKQWPPNH